MPRLCPSCWRSAAIARPFPFTAKVGPCAACHGIALTATPRLRGHRHHA